MRAEQLPGLVAATDALYLREHAKVREILQEEASVRRRLRQLDDQAAAARAGGAEMAQMRAIGADVQWQAWQERTRRALNMELARVLARKAAAMDKVRLAYGRKAAVAELSKVEAEKARARRQKLLMERCLNL